MENDSRSSKTIEVNKNENVFCDIVKNFLNDFLLKTKEISCKFRKKTCNIFFLCYTISVVIYSDDAESYCFLKQKNFCGASSIL